MSYRRHILARLKHFRGEVGPPGLLSLDPTDILGKPADQKYAAAINQLLEEKLVLGKAGVESNRPAFCLNPDKLNEIEEELRWYRDPALQWLVGAVIATCGLAWAVISFLLKK
jgi:hypothetical protein